MDDKRQAAVDYVFPNGWPSNVPELVADVSPVVNAQGDFYRMSGTTGAWLHHNAETITIVAQGHSHHIDDLGCGDLIRQLTVQGVDVICVTMPDGEDWTSGTSASHNHSKRPLADFAGPVAEALNTVSPGQYKTVAMVGISGGGWLTTLYTALDNRISLSIPVAGSYPLSLRQQADLGDWEQGALPDSEPFWRTILSYEEAYSLGASNGKQIQVLNEFDSCCFHGDGRHRQYEDSINGDFSVVIDSTHEEHKISQHIINTVILPELGLTVVRDIIDNEDLGRTVLVGPQGQDNSSGAYGEWIKWTNQGYRGSVLNTYNQGSLSWTAHFANLQGTYDVYATWHPHANRATNARYDFAGQSVRVNQQNTPAGKTADGASWHLLGTATVDGDLNVTLHNQGANGYVVADAVMIERQSDWQLADTTTFDAIVSNPTQYRWNKASTVIEQRQ